MKALLLFVLIATASAELFTSESVNAVDPYDFFKGFLVTIGDTENLNELIVCLNKLDPAKNLVRQGLELLITFEGPKMVEGMQKIIAGGKKTLEILTPCINKYPKLKSLVANIKTASVISLGWKVLRYFSKLRDISLKALACLKVEDLRCVGVNLGIIMKGLFLEKMATVSSDNPLLDFLKGFLLGIGDQGDPEELLKCINSLDSAIEKIKQGLQYIFSGNLDEIMKGLSMVIEAVREMLAKMKPCAEGLKVFKKLWEAILNADIAKILRKVLLNLNTVFGVISSILRCFDDDDFECAGNGIGKFMKFLFLDN